MAGLAKAVARRIRQARERAGLTQEALAQRVRVETTTLSRYERGELGVSLEMLDRLADALDMLLEAEALSRTTAMPVHAVTGRTLLSIAAMAKAK